jgi:hypothetical protein
MGREESKEAPIVMFQDDVAAFNQFEMPRLLVAECFPFRRSLLDEMTM